MYARIPVHSNLRYELRGLSDNIACETNTASDWARDAAHLLREPALGVYAGRGATRGWGDLLELTMECAPTLRAALSVLVRHAPLAWEVANFHLHVTDPVAVLQLAHLVPVSHVLRDFVLATLLYALERWLGGGLRMDVWLSHDRERHGTNYGEAFGPWRAGVGTSWDALVFSSELLETPLFGADGLRHAILMRHLEQCSLHRDADDGSLSERTSREIARLLGSSEVSLQRVAQALGTNSRTLSRRLAVEGTTFSDLLNEARKAHVLHYLECTTMSVKRIAQAVGYTSTASLCRAFNLWMGCSPLRYRREASLARANS